MIGNQNRWQEDLRMAGPLSSLIPDDHILKRVDQVLDLSWLKDEVQGLYCCDNGRPGIDQPQRLVAFLGSFFEWLGSHFGDWWVYGGFDVVMSELPSNFERNDVWRKTG